MNLRKLILQIFEYVAKSFTIIRLTRFNILMQAFVFGVSDIFSLNILEKSL